MLSAALAMELGHGIPAIDPTAACQRLELADPNLSEEHVFQLFRSRTSGAHASSPLMESCREAMHIIALHQSNRFLQLKSEDPDADVAPSFDFDQPVGLSNIGNTCYMNSLLQYFYTVKGFRDIVINFPEYRMPLDQIQGKMVRRQITKPEIARAQRCKSALT